MSLARVPKGNHVHQENGGLGVIGLGSGVLTLTLRGYVTSLSDFTSLGLSFLFYKVGITTSTS